MTLTRIGGLAALICTAAYIVGFALLVTLLAPLGFGTGDVDPAAVVAFNAARPGVCVPHNVPQSPGNLPMSACVLGSSVPR